MAVKKQKPTPSTRQAAPAKTVEGRENQLVGLAVDLAEKQLADGTASSQVMTHFLKLGTVRAKLEMEKLKQENLLLAARTKALESAERIEALYLDALNAMRDYRGSPSKAEEEDDEDED